MARPGRDVPQDIDAEKAVLGSIFIEPEAITQVAPLLNPEDFFRAAHRTIYRACLTLHERGMPAEYLLVSSVLEEAGRLDEVGGATFLAQLTTDTPTAAYAVHYAQLVAQASLRRRLIKTSTAITAAAYEAETAETALDQAESLVLALSAAGRTKRRFVRLGELLGGFLDEVEQLEKQSGQPLGVPSGLTDLDALTNGFHPGALVILAGRPGTGKTSMSLNMAVNAARTGVPVGVFSLEMGQDELRQRIACGAAGVNAQTVRRGKLSDDEWSRLVSACAALDPLPLWIDDTPALPILELRTKARRLQQEHGLGLVVVDYLQLMRGTKQENRVQEVTEISQALKALARELGVAVVALSQLNRSVESRPDRRPQLSDLRESGSIEQEADLVLFLNRPELYDPDTTRKGICDVQIAKHRSGPTGEVALQFTAEFTRFGDLDTQHTGWMPGRK